MAFSYTGGRGYYGTLTNSSDSNHLANGDILITASIKKILSLANWSFLEKTVTVPTVAGQRTYQIPANINDVIDDLYITTSDEEVYLPDQIVNSADWKLILRRISGQNDDADFWYRQDSTVFLDPIPSTSGNNITMVGMKRFGKLENADYTTGTASINNGSKTVTGAGTTFTAAMVGRFISFTSGDDLLYEIASYTSATEITLTKPYAGSNVASSAFVIGEYSPIPFEFQDLPIHRSAAMYWTKEGDFNRANYFWQMYDGGYEIGKIDEIGGSLGQMLNLYGQKSQSPYTGNRLPPISTLRERPTSVTIS